MMERNNITRCPCISWAKRSSSLIHLICRVFHIYSTSIAHAWYQLIKRQTGKAAKPSSRVETRNMYLAAFEIMFLPPLLKFTTRSTSLVSCGGLVLASDAQLAIPVPERNRGTGCSPATCQVHQPPICGVKLPQANMAAYFLMASIGLLTT